MFKSLSTLGRVGTGLLLLGALGGCSAADSAGESVGSASQSLTIGVDSFLYLTCNATGWSPSSATRLVATSDPNVWELSYSVTQQYMVSQQDDCQITQTNAKDSWGTSSSLWATDTSLLNVPASSHFTQSGAIFHAKYPALGQYKASLNWATKTLSIGAATQTAQYSPRVLFVGYNPSDGTTTLADRYFSGLYGGKTAAQVEVATAQAQVDAFTSLSGGRIKYQVVATVHDRTFPVYSDGSTYTMDSYGPCAGSGAPQYCEDRKKLFQYENWVTQNNLCAVAAQNNVDEIWVQSAPYIMTWENFMIGPTPGFDVNGPSFVTSGCSKHYVVHNPTYAAAPQAFLHIYGHRIEATMNFLTGKWQAADRQQHWERFAVTSRYAEPYNVIEPDLPNPYCGNAHWPSNAQSHYDYGNTRQKASICGDWANFPNYTGASTTVTCSNWGCSDNGWGAYWIGALPHSSGSVSMTSASGHAFAFPKDWWSLLLYPDQALSFNAPL